MRPAGFTWFKNMRPLWESCVWDAGRAGKKITEIPGPTCPTRSHFIQDKLKIPIYLSLDKYKGSQYNSVFHILINYYQDFS